MKTLTKNFTNRPAWGCITLTLVICSLFLLQSCEKDPKPKDDLIGTWTTEDATFSATVNGKTMTQYFIDEFGITAAEAQLYTDLVNTMLQESFTGTIQFKSDNSYTGTLGGEADNGTWSLSSDAKKLTIDSTDGDPATMNVIELTATKLHLQGTETENDDLNEDGIDETLVVTIDLTLTK